ncbi:helix-turn-helix domain-containing protein [Pseudomonas putida]|uniref:helix-turn-helix domain-containing protein n=1 Tax=Pseudomonas putida TaxID=303 RepID=UPI002022CFDD|nr:helix-turn-helix transcriptional regulator [Pseudomonas putida]MCL8304586.1 helix-turn-helix domain-containing protein [Pseudomonas putida]
MNIGERLREERVRLGYNQADFAAIAGVAKTSQFNYEKGDRSPDADYLAAIAEKGVDVLYVVTGVRSPQPTDSITPEEAGFVQLLRTMDESDRAILGRTAQAFAMPHSKKRE